jgi:hypothetical protein
MPPKGAGALAEFKRLDAKAFHKRKRKVCFSLAWLEQLLIWLVIVGAIIAIIKLLIPYVASAFGSAGSIIVAALNIILWAIIAIAVISICFSLISCLIGSSGGLHLMPTR